MSFIIGFNNYADSAALTGGSWQTPLSNLQDPRPSKKSRSTNATTANTKIQIDLGASYSVRLLALTHTNLSSDAQWRLTWFSDAFVTSVDDTGFLPIDGYPETDPDSIGASIFHVLDAAITARYLQVDIDDDANTDGFVEIGRLFVPEVFEPENGYGETNSETYEANTEITRALGGAGYYNRRTPFRKFSATLERLLETEIKTFRRMVRICGVNKQVVVIPQSEDTDCYNERNFVATFDQLPGIQVLHGDEIAASSSIELTEVVG